MSDDDYTTGHIDELGEGYGFRKIRTALGVTAFGVNALVVPPGYGGNLHYHDEQEELYFIHQGTAEMEFGDGTKRTLTAGGLARVAAKTPRVIRNVGSDDLVYLCVGGKDGYIGRDAHLQETE
jgi:mannose-6-phosphate isomerase-like protein (cupin superfamily)